MPTLEILGALEVCVTFHSIFPHAGLGHLGKGCIVSTYSCKLLITLFQLDDVSLAGNPDNLKIIPGQKFVYLRYHSFD